VSRALRNLPSVTETTRAKVAKVAAELGYVPSRSASALASGHTRSVGLIAPAISRWFFANAFEGAEYTLREAGFDALLYSIPESLRGGGAFDADVLRSRVDAVVVASRSFSEDEANRLRSLGVPVVFLSVRQPGFPHVGIDDDLVGRMATAHLLELGHTRIGHIGGSKSDTSPFSPTKRRRAGWWQTMRAAGLEPPEELDIESPFNAKGGMAATHMLLDAHPELTALVVGSDEMAFGSIQAIRERGLQVGADVSVIGVDGHDLDDIMGLTTIAQPAFDQGARAARLALELVSGTAVPTEQLFPVHLVQRSSTGPLI
jgi:DNA-binding LacI/PurR family transcriptional regulator